MSMQYTPSFGYTEPELEQDNMGIEENTATLIEASTTTTKKNRQRSKKKTATKLYHINGHTACQYDAPTLSAIADIERIDLHQHPEPNIYLSAKDIVSMTDEHNILFIRGSNKNRVFLDTAYQLASQLIGDTVYYQFVLGKATLFIETGINITVTRM